MKLVIPMRLPSLANPRHAGGDYHGKARTVKAQRLTVGWQLRTQGDGSRLVDELGELSVLLVRVAPLCLDDDNLRGACKPARDEIAKWLGLANDRDHRVSWLYNQRPGQPALEISIGRRRRCAHCGAVSVEAA